MFAVLYRVTFDITVRYSWHCRMIRFPLPYAVRSLLSFPAMLSVSFLPVRTWRGRAFVQRVDKVLPPHAA